MQRQSKTSYMIKISLLGVISFIIMMLEFPLPFFPDFLKIDLSDITAVIGGFALGPIAGIGVELIKNLLHLFKTTTSGVGEFANFIVGSAFVGTAALYYKIHKSKKGAVIGMLFGIAAMAVVGAFANIFILIPFYSNFMPVDAIVALGSAVNKAIVSVSTLVIYAIVPFNLVKGVIIGLVTFPIYKKISVLLHG